MQTQFCQHGDISRPQSCDLWNTT